MYRIIGDTHTHSIVSGDAHSTISENIFSAKAKQLNFICLTEHVNYYPFSATVEFFLSMTSIPRLMDGMYVYRGVEANIIDFHGNIDMPTEILDKLDWCIASMHSRFLKPSTQLNHTNAWVKLAQNPSIDVIGHSGNPAYSFELKPVMQAFKEGNKIVEINNHSFTQRKGSRDICKQIAEMCAEYEVPVVVSSDAHFSSHVGEFPEAISLLEEIHFPKNLILEAISKRSNAPSFLNIYAA